jgi:hypothetical protein
LKYLKAGEEVWHESKLRAEWEEGLKGGGIEIWMEWMEWRIRRAARGIKGVVEDGERILRSLGDGEDDEIGKLRVFWRVAVALQDAGMLPVFVISILGLNMLIQVTQNVRQLSSKHKLNCKPVP